ncbi:MAG: precorrin-8X methylmutase [Chloroflexota bacterium]|nr:precorrin-8X methylmutase [Chloroflexota bacterium]
MINTGIVILAHGSRGEKGMTEITEVLRRLSHGVRAFLSADVEVAGASLQFNHPDLDEAVGYLVRQGATRVVIVPYFLFPGRHITEHIPQLVENLKSAYPGTNFNIADNLGLDEYLVDLVAKRILETAPELAPDGAPHVSPRAIEQQSMAIVERLLPPLDLSPEELTVVKRLVHTAGDRHIASLVRFHPVAITVALAAIRLGRPIFTDVRMAAVAVNGRLAAKFGCPVYCALEELGAADTDHVEGSTRTSAAFHHLGERLNESIVAIGNSPTALLTLVALITQKKVTPAIVIGMPVGFVQAKESKEKLVELDIPYISIAGTRGGSALAAATVNALLGLAGR